MGYFNFLTLFGGFLLSRIKPKALDIYQWAYTLDLNLFVQ